MPRTATPAATGSRGRTPPAWCSRYRSTACWATPDHEGVTTTSHGLDLTGVDLPTAPVRTDRLVLRPWRADDEDAVFSACQDPEIQRWIGLTPVPYGLEDARRFVTETAPGER